jgi:hypothetical protein
MGKPIKADEKQQEIIGVSVRIADKISALV